MILPDELKFDEEKELERIKNFIRDALKKLNKKKVYIGLSGGIDSAIILKLLTLSMDKENIFALIMPDKDSKRENLIDAVEFSKSLGVRYKIINISKVLSKFGIYRSLPYFILPTKKLREKVTQNFYKNYEKKFGKSPFYLSFNVPEEVEKDNFFNKGIAYHRIKHRIRMVYLYYYAELNNAAVAGTTNKTEINLGFFVKYGDSASDFEPIAHLFKSQIFKLSEYLKIPEKIILKPPSPDLLPGITDEFAMGLNYEMIDRVLFRFLNEEKPETISKELNLDKKLIDNLYLAYANSESMKNLPLNLL
ncbi:MAG TPA: NAD(+) synthase [Caldisericia bacterium]|nr:NAD(+) synthase [Caldisericia bacterium]